MQMLFRRLPLRVFAFVSRRFCWLREQAWPRSSASRSRRKSQNAPLTKDQEVALARVRAWSEGYSASLPDYICIQTTKRNAQPGWPGTRGR